jgi:hypothetical protein
MSNIVDDVVLCLSAIAKSSLVWFRWPSSQAQKVTMDEMFGALHEVSAYPKIQRSGNIQLFL